VLGIAALALVEGTRINVLWQFGAVLAAVFGGRLFTESDVLRRVVGAILIAVAAGVVIVF